MAIREDRPDRVRRTFFLGSDDSRTIDDVADILASVDLSIVKMIFPELWDGMDAAAGEEITESRVLRFLIRVGYGEVVERLEELSRELGRGEVTEEGEDNEG